MYDRASSLASFAIPSRYCSASGSLATVTRASAGLRVDGAPVRYEMTLEPSRLAMLPLKARDGSTSDELRIVSFQ